MSSAPHPAATQHLRPGGMAPRFSFAWSSLLGYDVFISYRRSEASEYAEKLFRDLTASGLTPFLDRSETPGGAELAPTLLRALKRSRMLVVLLTPDVLHSTWVQQEVETFARFPNRAIAPINIDDYLRKRNLDGTCLARLKDYSWIEETLQGLRTGVPSETVLAEVLKGASKVRVKTLSRLIVTVVIVSLTLVSIVALIQMRQAQRQTELALTAQLAAQAELARTQEGADVRLAATLAAESLSRSPSLLADQTLRAVLESLATETAEFSVDAADEMGFAADGKSVLLRRSGERVIKQYDLAGRRLGIALDCAKWAVCEAEVSKPLALLAEDAPEGASVIHARDLVSGADKATFEWSRRPARMTINDSVSVMATITPEGHVCTWDLSQKKQGACFDGPSNAHWKLNANGKLLAAQVESESDDEDILDSWRVWDTSGGTEVDLSGEAEGKGIGAKTLTMSTTGRYVVGTTGDTRVRVLDLERNQSLPSFEHEDVVGQIMFNPNDALLVTTSAGYWIRIWVLEAERPESRALAVPVGEARSLLGFASDGIGIVTSGVNGSAFSVWRMSYLQQRPELREGMRAYADGPVRAVASHPDGFTFATLDEQNVVRVWDGRDGNILSLTRQKQAPEIASKAEGGMQCKAQSWFNWPWTRAPKVAAKTPSADTHLDPCGKYEAFLTSSPNDDDPGSVIVRRTSDSSEVVRIHHSRRVNDARFSQDGRYLATGGSDHAIKVWDLMEIRQVTSIQMETRVQRVEFTDSGRTITAVGDEDLYGRTPVIVYRWRPEDLISAVAGKQIRKLSPSEWARYLGPRKPLAVWSIR